MTRHGCIVSKTNSKGIDLILRNAFVFSITLVTWLIFSPAATAAAYDLLVSSYANRSNAVSLAQGQSLSGNIYVFTGPDKGVARVSFYLDDLDMSGSPERVETSKPFDLGGTAKDGSAAAYDTTRLSAGYHFITALVKMKSGGTVTISRMVNVATGAATSQTGSTTLYWVAPSTRADGSPLSLSAIASYGLYHGTVASKLSLMRNISDPTTTTYTVSNLSTGTHYFAISTRDTSGLESAMSKVLSKTIQ
jgi:hypothetical protein